MNKEKKQTYYLISKYMITENVKINITDLIIEKIGVTAYKHFKSIVLKMEYDNSVDFWLLKLKETQIKRLRAKIHKAGFIRRLKLDKDWKWFCNPYLYNKDNRVNKQLEDIFRYDKDNKYFLELNF